MEQFDKWWNKKYSHREGNDNSHLGYPEAHQAWKAALEYALTLKFKYNPKYNDNTKVILAGNIEKELSNDAL